jgi:hypothetical protein
VLERRDLVMKLHQDRLRRHLPVHPERLRRSCITTANGNPFALQEALAFRPHGTGRVKRLKLDTNEVPGLPVTHGNKAVVDAPAGHGQLANDP